MPTPRYTTRDLWVARVARARAAISDLAKAFHAIYFFVVKYHWVIIGVLLLIDGISRIIQDE